MTFFGKIFSALGHLFTNLGKEAEKTYDSLPADVQKALVSGSAPIAVINAMLDKSPKEIIAAIQSKFPMIDLDQLETKMYDVSQALNLDIPPVSSEKALEALVEAIKVKLSTVEKGKVWEGISFGLSSLLAILFAPADTKFAAISSLLEYVYHEIVKPKIQS